MSERIFRNPTPVGRVTVRATPTHPPNMPHNRDSRDNPIPVREAWNIYVNGQRTGYRVVDTRWGDTILDPEGNMVTCWHAGAAPGDLARLTANGARAQTYGMDGEG